MMKIGVAIITCKRHDFFFKLLDTIPHYVSLVVIDDGNDLEEEFSKRVTTGTLNRWPHIITNKTNKQVGFCKNQAMKYLLDNGYDYIFTLEDDILIKDPAVFEKYIATYKATGIAHMNFGFSQRENLDQNLQPVYKKIVEYDDETKIVLTPNILGAFTFYTREALQHIGLHHYKFNKGHGDHPELTYRAYKHGFTTPFWWFADVYESWKMIENQSNMGSDSLVRNQEKFHANFAEANEIFKSLHGYRMVDVPDVGEKAALQTLRDIKRSHDARV